MSLTQKSRLLAIETVLGADVLALRSVGVQEQISRLFQIEAELSSDNGLIKFDDVVGHNATVRLQVGDKDTRYFNGFVSRFVQVANQGGYAHYRATLVPWLWFLTRTADCRIFLEKKVPEIVEEVFKGHGFNDYQLKLSGSYKVLEYCAQYRETDFNFVSRLMEQAGIYYFFTHENGKHTLVLADSASAHSPFPGYEDIIFSELEKGANTREVVTDWSVEKEVQTVAYALNDFDFKKPKASLRSIKDVTRQHGAAQFEIYDYPGEYVELAEGARLAQVRLDELQSQHDIRRGKTLARGLAAGSTFKLKQHPRADQNCEYLVTGVTLNADAGEYASGGGGGGDFFSCSFTVIEKAQQFRAARLSTKPVVHGLQTAIVVGPSGEEIHTDKFGRVKVQFHWDRYGKADENSSCWMRVSQSWAGKQWGAIYLPRIGQEVIVEFLEGDPDRPLITGRVYNGEAMPPYDLPAEKTKSTLKSNSSKGGGGFNEIRFEDKKGDEQVFIHAEKDEDIRVKNDAREWIGNERHLTVKKDQLELVEGDKHSTVKGDRLSTVKGDHGETTKGGHFAKIDGDDHLTVGGAQSTKIGADASLKVGSNWNNEAAKKFSLKAGTDVHVKAGMTFGLEAGTSVHIKGGTTVVIEAGAQLSLKVGGNFVDINPGGVFIKGTMVMINSGGSAGSGGGSSPTAPTAPEAPDPPKEPKEADNAKSGAVTTASASPATKAKGTYDSIKVGDYSPAAAVLKQAAEDGTPFCEECARAAEEEKAEVEEELAVISSIAWLDGAKDKENSGDVTQWVNLPHDAKWVDAVNGVANIDRLGRKIRYKVTFSKPGSHSFKVKAVPGDDNVGYTTAEEGRNPNFKWLEDEKSYTTDSDGTKVVETDFFSTCAGLDAFKLVAEDTQNSPPVETGFATTKRLVHVLVIKMKDMTTNADLSTLRSEYASHGIELVELPAVEIDRMANIGPSDEDAYKQKCKAAFNGSPAKSKLPYAVAVGFTEHLAVKNSSQVLELTGVEAGPGKDPAEIPVMARGLRSGDGLRARSLWKDLVPGESWFVSATYTPDAGGAPRNIPGAKCTALPDDSASCRSVKVEVSDLPAGTGTLRVTVHVVDRMRGGLSFTSGNLICICTKAWWQTQEADVQSSTAIHEMGHKVGMVANGTGKLPDKVETQYDAKGHVGSHCHFGLAVLDTYVGVSGNKCVMFGAVGAGSPTDFCEKCTPAVRKVDLSAGWTA